MLTSTEKEVRYLKEEINHWKSKFEALKVVVERLDRNGGSIPPNS